MTTNNRPLAVFSTDDFRLIREALAVYAKAAPPGQDAARCASLYHRLGRVNAPPATPTTNG